MSRLANAILQPGAAYGAGRQHTMVDLAHGGQMGFAPDLTEWVSNQAYVRRNIIAVLVEAPRGFQLLPNPEQYVGTLRSLVELHAMSIEGLNLGLEVEITSTPVGGGGQNQHDFTNVKETESNVTFRFNEKHGMPIGLFHKSWITMLMMDPNTKYPGIISLTGQRPTDLLPDFYSATMCFFEPDPTHSKVVKSWLVTNMFPQSTGEINGRRDVTAALEPVSYDIVYGGLAQTGLGVDAFAQRILDSMSLTGANPNLRPAFVDNITADVQAARRGYANNIEGLTSTAIQV